MGENWRLGHHYKLEGITPEIPSGLHFPTPINEHEASHRAVAFAPDDSCIARIVRTTRVIINEFNADNGGVFGKDKVIHTGQSQLSCLSFGPTPKNMYMVGSMHSPRSRYILATGHRNGSIRLWDADTTQLATSLCSHKQKITDIVFSQRTDGVKPVLISISCDRELKVWDGEYSGWNMSHTLRLNASGGVGVPLSVTFHPSSKFFAVSGTSRTVEVYNLGQRTNGLDEGWVDKHSNSCGLSQQLGSLSDWTDRSSDLQPRLMLKNKLNGHSAGVVRCKYTSDGALLLTASWDTRVCLWNTHSGDLVVTCLTGNMNPSHNNSLFVFSGSQIRDVSCDFSCSAIATVATDGNLSVWDPWSPEANLEKECSPITGNKDLSYSAVYQPEILTNLPAGASSHSISPKSYTSLTFSNKNNFVVVSDEEGGAQVYTLSKPVPSLAHLCRNRIRATALERWPINRANEAGKQSEQEKELNRILPKTLQSYLSYEVDPRATISLFTM